MSAFCWYRFRSAKYALWLPLLIGVQAVPTFSGELRVAAASDLNFAIKDIITEFEEETGHEVKLSLGSSGNFYSQIVNGAPYDMYFSADISYARKLEDAGLAEPGSLFLYAIGQIVLWVPNNSKVDLDRSGMRAVEHPSVRRIAIANPRHAPYGRAAVASLKHFKLYDRIRQKLVYGENVLQAAQFVQSGGTDIAILALSLASSPFLEQAGRTWRIPKDSHPSLEQAAIILRQARRDGNLAATRAFRNWVKAISGRRILERYGFILPDETPERVQR